MGSPIEQMLECAFARVLDDRELCDMHYNLTPDVMVGGYRFDFVMRYFGNDVFGVECDGHEWHERTRQQASYDRARDRALLKLGLPTVRFTGSDIHRDAEQCALELIEIADALYARSPWLSMCIARRNDDEDWPG